MARDAGGAFLLRLEDIDASRCRPEFAAGIVEDLAWLGLAWTGEVRVQSAHRAEYAACLARLTAMEMLYPCFCTRAEIAAAMTAPHETAPLYPGTCRHLGAAERAARIARGDAYALRLDMARALSWAKPDSLRYHEVNAGWITVTPAILGDVVLARKDFPGSYHLCAVHDDALQGITHVTRGEDLASATHLHVLLQHLLGLPVPRYAHHRLIRDETGRRLAKRDASLSLKALRDAGETPANVLARLDRMAAS